jgi:hypothetical protein
MADAPKYPGRPAPPGGAAGKEPREPDEIALPPPAEGTALLRGEDAGRGVPVPIADLARAFQASAEALRGVHDMQLDMAKALKRNDRSEMMLQSTNALNETFRGLMLVQREMLSRMNAFAAPPRNRAVPLMILGLLVVVIAGVYLVLDYVEERAGKGPDAETVAQDRVALYQRGREEAAREKESEAFRLRQLLEESDRREQEARAKLDAERETVDGMKRNLQELEAERDGIARQAAVAQSEAIRARAVEGEMRDLSTKLAVVEPQLLRLEAELQAQRSENLRLKKRLASFESNLPPEDEPRPSANPPAPPPAPAKPSESKPGEPSPPPPGPPAATEPTVPAARDPLVRDPRLIAQVRSRLNNMLDVSGRGRPSYLQVTRIDGLAEDRLAGVIALQYDAQGRLMESIEAKRLEIWIDRTRREVHFEFREGDRKVGPNTRPFEGGRHELIVADGDLVKIWGQSGLVMVKSRT